MSLITYKNFVKNTIKSCEIIIVQNKTKQAFFNSKDDMSRDPWAVKQFEKNGDVIMNMNDKIIRYKEYLSKLDKEIVPDEFLDEYEVEVPTIKQAPKKEKIVLEAPKFLKPQFQRVRYVNYNKEYFYYNKSVDKIPSYIHNNLKNMPCNKGYIYNGIWLYGSQRADSDDTTIMFEKNSKSTLTIHEITKTTHKISEKKLDGNRNKKQKQRVVSITPRRVVV